MCKVTAWQFYETWIYTSIYPRRLLPKTMKYYEPMGAPNQASVCPQRKKKKRTCRVPPLKLQLVVRKTAASGNQGTSPSAVPNQVRLQLIFLFLSSKNIEPTSVQMRYTTWSTCYVHTCHLPFSCLTSAARNTAKLTDKTNLFMCSLHHIPQNCSLFESRNLLDRFITSLLGCP
jgi:hypothetical protein